MYTWLFWQILGFVHKTDAHTFLQTPAVSYKHQIILLPGIYERWDFMKPIARALLAHGYSVHVIEGLGYNRLTVEQASNVVEKYIHEKDLKNCIIVAHSKGGLIGKYLLDYGSIKHRFAGMVALNTPFGGSIYAHIFPLASLRIFTPTSPLIRRLSQSRDNNKKIYSIFSTFDPHIPTGSNLEGATNIKLPIYGHFRIIKDKQVHSELLKAVENLENKTAYTLNKRREI